MLRSLWIFYKLYLCRMPYFKMALITVSCSRSWYYFRKILCQLAIPNFICVSSASIYCIHISLQSRYFPRYFKLFFFVNCVFIFFYGRANFTARNKIGVHTLVCKLPISSIFLPIFKMF